MAATAGVGGTISPAQLIVGSGGTATFTIGLDSEREVDVVSSSCGGSLTGNTFTTGPVTANCVVAVSFIPDFANFSGDGVRGPDSDLISVQFDDTTYAISSASSLAPSGDTKGPAAVASGAFPWLSQHVDFSGCTDGANGLCGPAAILMAALYLNDGRISLNSVPLVVPHSLAVPSALGHSGSVGSWVSRIAESVLGWPACGRAIAFDGDNNEAAILAKALGLGIVQFEYTPTVTASGDPAKKDFLYNEIRKAHANGQVFIARVSYQGDGLINAGLSQTDRMKGANARRELYFNGGSAIREMGISKDDGSVLGHIVLVFDAGEEGGRRYVDVYDTDPFAENTTAGKRRYSFDSFWSVLPHEGLNNRRILHRLCSESCDVSKAFEMARDIPLQAGVEYTVANTTPVPKSLAPGKVRFYANGLPAGLRMEQDGRILGTTNYSGPPVDAIVGMTLLEAGKWEKKGEQALTVVVSAGKPTTPGSVLVGSVLTRATVGVHYTYELGSNLFGETTNYTIIEGRLPDGISPPVNGVIAGVPTTPGRYSFVLGVAGSSRSASKALTLYVDPAPAGPAVPAPSVTGLEPPSLFASSQQQTITLIGTNFDTVSVVRLEDKSTGELFWKRNLIPTDGGTRLNVSANFTSTPAPWSATAIASNGVESSPFSFSVVLPTTPPPKLDAVRPIELTASSSRQDATLTGSGFQNGLTVEVSHPLSGTRGSGQLNTVTSGEIVASFAFDRPGSWEVRVINSDGGSSSAKNISVKTPAGTAAPQPPTGATPGTTNTDGVLLGASNFNLQWTATANATFYNVAVRDLTTSQLIVDKATSETSLPVALERGRLFRWNLSACNPAGCSAYTAPLYFRTPGTTVSPPLTPSGPAPGSTTAPGPTASSASVTLSWGASAGATRYDVGVRDLTTNQLVVDNANVPGTSLAVSLVAGRQYRWNLAACNTAGCSAFTTLLYFQTPAAAPTIPATPTGPSPGSTTSPGPTTASSTVTLSWNASTGATSYDVGVRDIASDTLVVNNSNVSGSSLSVSLSAGRAYRWNVAACNAAGCSSFTTPLYFQTPGATPSPPSTPSGASPGSTTSPGPTTSSSSVTLTWNASSGATRYDVGVRDIASDTLVVNNANVSGTSLTASLTAGRQYRWNVAACNAGGCSSFTSPLYFQTPSSAPAIPSIPTGTTPGSSSSPGPVQSSSTVALDWSSVSGATYYEVGVRDMSTNTLVVDTTTSSSNYSASLSAERTYRWNVAACNSSGCSSFTTALYFQTPSSASPPATPTGTSPGSTSSPGPLQSSTNVALDWSSVSGATYYEIGVRDMTTNTLVVDTTTTSSNYSASLSSGRTYRWNVAACNAAGCSSFTAQLYFRTP